MALKLSTQALKLLSHVFLNAQLSISGANTAPVLFNQLHIVILISDCYEDNPSEAFVQSAQGLHTTIEWEASSVGGI